MEGQEGTLARQEDSLSTLASTGGGEDSFSSLPIMVKKDTPSSPSTEDRLFPSPLEEQEDRLSPPPTLERQGGCLSPVKRQEDRLSSLPTVVLLRLLRLLRRNFSDVLHLSYTSKWLRRRVLEDLRLVYTPLLVLDTGRPPLRRLHPERPVLALRLVCSDSLAGCLCEAPCPATCAALPARVAAHTAVLAALGTADLSVLRSLHLTNRSQPDQGEAYRGLLKVLPLNPSLCCASLQHLSVDVCLINLSEIRQAIINVVYQHNDFDNGANIDYIINSAVSQILYTLLIFLDDLYNESRGDQEGLVRGLVVRRSRLTSLHLNFQAREKTDWSELDPHTFSLTEAEHLRNCLAFMINEFKERVGLQYGVTDSLRVTGVPAVFRSDIVDLTTAAISEACDLWPCDPHRKPFEITSEDHPQGFSLLVSFPRASLATS